MFRDCFSTFVEELPKGEQVVKVYDVGYFYQTAEVMGFKTRIHKAATEYYAIVYLRVETPSVIGEGATKDSAVEDLLSQLYKLGLSRV